MICTTFEVYETPRGSGKLIYVPQGDFSFAAGTSRRFVGVLETEEMIQVRMQEMYDAIGWEKPENGTA